MGDVLYWHKADISFLMSAPTPKALGNAISESAAIMATSCLHKQLRGDCARGLG